EQKGGYSKLSGGTKEKNNPTSPENQESGKEQESEKIKTGSGKRGRRKGDTRDKLENVAIKRVTGVDGRKIKELEARYEQNYRNDRFHRSLRKGAGTDWENMDYRNQKQNEEDVIRDELGEEALERHRAG